ncbi:MAG: transposase [Myxococcales bacterium]|nr:transposase [Myxococcales bacterium]
MNTLNGEFFLKPGEVVTSTILGVMGRAQEQTRVKIHAFEFMSTHFHLLITVRNVEQMSKFMRLFNGNLSKKLNHLYGRRGTMWHRRYSAIGVTPDEATQMSRLRYVMAHGVKEDLVEKVGDWPGASSLPWLLRGESIYGVWTDFTARYKASRRKNYQPFPGEFDTVYEVHLTEMPCWADVGAEDWRQTVREMAAEIDATAAERRLGTGARVLGVKAVLAAHRTTRLTMRRRTPAPLLHAVNPHVYVLVAAALKLLRRVYDEASVRFRAGDWDVEFPEGVFRPSGGFVVPRDALALETR